MSTSPDTQKGNNFLNRLVRGNRSDQTRGRPGLIILKGILWLALMVGLLVALAMNYEIVWDVLVGTVIPGLETLFEVAEQLLDSFFLMVGVGAAFAPMATAYTGFVLVLAIVYLLARRVMTAYQKIQNKKQEVSQTYASAWDEWYGTIKATARERLTVWWNSLDSYNKVFAVAFMTLIVIPIMLLLSLILGNLVASLI
jgi:hypothetical protein